MESSQETLRFPKLSGRRVEADFDGGTTTSDAGALLVRQAEAKVGIIDRVAKALSDSPFAPAVPHLQRRQ